MNQNLKTRRQWRKQQFRRVKSGEQPVEYFTLRYIYRNYCVTVSADGSETTTITPVEKERKISLYSIEQTKPCKRLGAALLRDAYCRYFVDDAQKDTYLWWDDGWKYCRSFLDDEKIRQHLLGKEIYGIFGGQFTCFSTIDADYHGGNYEVFKDQLTAVLHELHGRDGWHYSFGPRGCHIIRTHPRMPTAAVRAELRKLLTEIDARHPELRERAINAEMKPISDWEIYPDPNQGFRLPLAKNRVVLLDKPCVDLASYIEWQIEPTYCPVEQVLAEIFKVIQPMEAAEKMPKEKCQKEKMTSEIGRVFGSLKGRYAKVLVDFWLGHDNPPDSLNCALMLTARMMPFYFDDRNDAVDYLEELIDALPDVSFSDRLSTGKRKVVSRIVRQVIRSAYDGNGHQPEPELSRGKLAKTFQAWESKGFSLVDRSTWRLSANSLANDFVFSDKELEGIGYFAKILNADLETTADATRHLLRTLAVHPTGQMSVRYVKNLLVGFGVKCGHHGKVNEYLAALHQAGWISLVAEYVMGSRGKQWEVGEKMQGKFLNPNLSQKPSLASILVSHFNDEQKCHIPNSSQKPSLASILVSHFNDKHECHIPNSSPKPSLSSILVSHFPINKQKQRQRDADIKEFIGKRQRNNENEPVKLQI